VKLPRVLLVWAALAVCAALVIGAMAWLTRNVLDSKREQAQAEARAALEEQTRLALWRMDAFGTAIVLRENQRLPHTDSPPAAEVRARFTLADGAATLAVEESTPAETLPTLAAGACQAAFGIGELNWQAMPKDNADLKMQAISQKAASPQQYRNSPDSQVDSNLIELAQRAKAVEGQAFLPNGSIVQGPDSRVSEAGVMRPVWIGGELYLLRRFAGTGNAAPGFIHGVWLDSAKVRAFLLAEVTDLLQGADLRPRPDDRTHPLSLASLPFDLVRNEVMPAPVTGWSAALTAGWIAVLAAIVMAALLVHGVMRLSERRASFVSAVTHELRTPLTTFRLYSDMLESGAVKPERRGDYLRVLSREADRLSHLVENVLAFSRIERGNARSSVRDITATELLDQSRERLAARLATAGLSLEMDGSCATVVRADTAAVEHILFNLIDNAAKYAASGDPPSVIITARETGRLVDIHVRDHGPGIPPAERKRVFRAFHKSAREAAESQPGVGLGLALSRRLARQQGGDLLLADDGFLLRLPAACQPRKDDGGR
jgi:signal transduction histidine kinase